MGEKLRVLTAGEIVPLSQATGRLAMGEPDDGMVTVQGQAAVYDQWFTAADEGRVIVQRRNRAGMFARSLSQNPNVALMIDHEVPVARTGADTLKIWETPTALMFQGRVNTKTSVGNDLVENMRSGLYTQGSVRYWPLKDYPRDPEWKDGKLVQYQDIAEGKLNRGDVTICMEGLNPACSTSLAQAVAAAKTLTPPGQPDFGLLRERETIRLNLNNHIVAGRLAQATLSPTPSEAPAGVVAGKPKGKKEGEDDV